MNAPRVGARILLARGHRTKVVRNYEEGSWFSITVRLVVRPSHWHDVDEFIVNVREEGTRWARGWNTNAAKALRAVASL